MSIYQKQWDYLQLAYQRERNPHALLFVGAIDRELNHFTVAFTELVLCMNKKNRPCHECIDCQMALQEAHPDVEWIKPEKSGGSIKIDQIRALQQDSYLAPQRAHYRIIIIEFADRMNTSAANSLLKILEEPAQHILFLLIAEQLGTMLPTVLSRCQILTFPPKEDLFETNIVTWASRYAEETAYSLIINQSESILDGLIAIIEKKVHPCVMAAQWMSFEFNVFLWFIYWVYAQIQRISLQNQTVTGPVAERFRKLALLLNPILIFTQIDKINTLRRKLSHNVTLNQALALEDLLFGLQEEHE
jgi:DNA polymerase-3 subunit delta'